MNKLNSKNLKKVAPKQGGFSLVELILVLAIGAILAVLGIPLINSYIIAGKVEPTVNDLRAGIASMRKNFTNGTTPYATLGTGAAATAAFANQIRGSAMALTITGEGNAATIQHGIGATGSQVTVASATITTAGDAYTITLPTVNVAACPDLAALMARTAEAISINGTVVKPVDGEYNGSAAANLCTDADTNTFVFTMR